MHNTEVKKNIVMTEKEKFFKKRNEIGKVKISPKYEKR